MEASAGEVKSRADKALDKVSQLCSASSVEKILSCGRQMVGQFDYILREIDTIPDADKRVKARLDLTRLYVIDIPKALMAQSGLVKDDGRERATDALYEPIDESETKGK